MLYFDAEMLTYTLSNPHSPRPTLSSALAFSMVQPSYCFIVQIFLPKRYCEGIVSYNTLAHQYLFVLQGEIKNPAKNS